LFRKVTPSSADGLLLVLPFSSCVPSGFVIPKDLMLLVRELEEGNYIEGTRLACATISRIHFLNRRGSDAASCVVLSAIGTIEIATVRHVKTALQRFPVDRTNEVSTIPCSCRTTRVSRAVRASSSSAHRYPQWLYRVRVSASSSPGWQINSYRPSGIFRNICSSAEPVKH